MGKPLLKSLPVRLTESEVLERGRMQAQSLKELQDLDTARKLSNEDFKQRRKKVEKRVLDLRDQIREGKEYREVECHERPDRHRKVIETVRNDTGDVVDVREMTSTEAQLSIDELEESLIYMARD